MTETEKIKNKEAFNTATYNLIFSCKGKGNKSMKILICDNDADYVAECKSLLFGLAEKHNVNITVDTVESGNRLLFFKDTKYYKTDLIYIAYNLNGINGIETARRLRKGGETADIVFCTYDESHAIDGYEVDALSYILKKDISSPKFEDTFLKAVDRCKIRKGEIMTFTYCNEHCIVPIRDILYFEVHNRTVTVHYQKDGETETFDFNSSLSKVQDQLLGKDFVRIHGSYLVSHGHIHKGTSQSIEMVNGDVLPIGKTHQGSIKN